MTFLQKELSPEQVIGIATTEANQRERNIDKYRLFYEGFQNVLKTDRQKQYLGSDDLLPDSFANILPQTIQVVQDRLAIRPNGKGIKAVDEQSQAYAEFVVNLWVNSDVDKQQDRLNRDLLKDGEAGLLVEWIGPVDDEDGTVVMTERPIWTPASNVGIRFEILPGTEDIVRIASYSFTVPQYDSEGTIEESWLRINVYVESPDGVLKYRYLSQDNSEYTPLTPEQIDNEIGQVVPNPELLPISKIPVVRFTNSELKSELEPLFTPQRMLNKAVGDALSASDYEAFHLLVAESLEQEEDQGEKVPISIQPGMVLLGKNIQRIAGGDIKAMWEGTYTKIIDLISQIKGFPLWLLNPQDTSIPASGVALSIAEGSLVQQVEAKQKILSPQWQEAFAVARQWANANGNAELDESTEIIFDWIPASTQNIIADMAVQVQTAKSAGLSDETIWTQIFNFTASQVKEAQEARLRDPDYWIKVTLALAQGANALVPTANILSVLGLSDEIITTINLIPSEAVEQ